MENVKFEVHDTAGSEELKPMKPYLRFEWCECEHGEFLVYADDNACPCGISKHHVHCKNCGGVMQIG